MLGTEIDEEDQPLQWYVVAAYMVAVIGGFALAVWFTVAWFSNCEDSGKTGTATSYAGDSMRNTLCHSCLLYTSPSPRDS